MNRNTKEKLSDGALLSLARELAASTPQALELLEKFRKGGLLDNNYMPVESLTKQEASLIAQKISSLLWHKNCWKPFSLYWNMKDLKVSYNHAINSPSSEWIIETMKNILKS